MDQLHQHFVSRALTVCVSVAQSGVHCALFLLEFSPPLWGGDKIDALHLHGVEVQLGRFAFMPAFACEFAQHMRMRVCVRVGECRKFQQLVFVQQHDSGIDGTQLRSIRKLRDRCRA